ncbi:HAD domain-containing protein [Roseomonas sp. 18066]|uniref:HAD domain-containing protein n=1 Tax=Roseomonas sp. 18066 TaxID=2681412 RepID=UPI0021081450|nr:HAD domain-containing protein [Roseomonas sp. 18066]
MVGAADPRREGQFDACAVALVSRICEVTGARIVVASSWRYTVGYKQTQMKLLEQGLPRTLFHEGWACPMARFSTPEKCDDITLWLEEHGITQTGSWLALDDEDIVPGATMTTDALDGLGAREAAAAVRYLGGADAGLGVRALSDSDMDLVRESFSGNRIAACRWLEGVDARAPRSQRPAALLTRDRREEVLRQLAVATGE